MLAQKQTDQKIRVTTLEMLLIGATALITPEYCSHQHDHTVPFAE
jgi:hypothetical protein